MKTMRFPVLVLLLLAGAAAGALAADDAASAPEGAPAGMPPARRTAAETQGAGAFGPAYIIGPGDVLGIEMWKDPVLSGALTSDDAAAHSGSGQQLTETPVVDGIVGPSYVVGPGDILGIEVWKDPVLTRQVVVLPDGRITFPLIGELKAGGRTVAQIKKEIEARIARYVTDAVITVEVRQLNNMQIVRQVAVLPDGRITFPLAGELDAGGKTVAQVKKEIETRVARYVPEATITVEVRQQNSMHIYVLGRVNAPGRVILTANVNVLQALAIAGGPNPFANRSKIRIFRQIGGRNLVYGFDYDEVTAGRQQESNIVLRRGDVIFVP